jgi:hypothetical protein
LHRARIAALALEAKLPAMSEMQGLTEAGCLFSYGSDNYYNWERAGISWIGS